MVISKKIHLYLLLTIHKNGNIEPLVEMGYEYSQIASFINNEVSNNNAEYINGDLKLTSKGLSLLNSYSDSAKSGSNEWITPEIQSRIPILNKNDVFLPDQNDLWLI